MPHRYRIGRNTDRDWTAVGTGSSGAVKLIYKPFGIILGILAGLLGKRLFDFVWTKIDDEEPPEAHDARRRTWAKVLAAAALQGVIFKRHARGRRPLRRDRLALPHRRLAGREAPGPGATSCSRLRRAEHEAALGERRRARPRSAPKSRAQQRVERPARRALARAPSAAAPARPPAPRPRRAGRAGSAARAGGRARRRRTVERVGVEHAQQLVVVEARAASCRRGARSEQLVLAAEDLGHRVVGEDAADRVRQQVGARRARGCCPARRRAAGSCR